MAPAPAATGLDSSTRQVLPDARAVITSIRQSLQADQPNQADCVGLMCPLGKMHSLRAPDQTLAQIPCVLPDHLLALGWLSKTSPTLDVRTRLLPILELLTMLVGTQDITHREGPQPTIPTAREQTAPFPRPLLSLFGSDHNGSDSSNLDVLPSGITNSRVNVKDRTDNPFNVDHLSQATATPTARIHGRVGESVRTTPSKQFVTSARVVTASIRQSFHADQLKQGECARLMCPLGRMLALLSPDQTLARISLLSFSTTFRPWDRSPWTPGLACSSSSS